MLRRKSEFQGDVPGESRALSLGPGDAGCSRDKGKDSGPRGLLIPQLCLLGGDGGGIWVGAAGCTQSHQWGWGGTGRALFLLQDTSNGHTGTGLCPLHLGKSSGNASLGGLFQREADRSPGRSQAALFN